MKGMISTFIERVQRENLNVCYAQMRVGGKITEAFSRFPQKTRMHLMSVSKSVVSAGAGIALGEGLIDLDENICEAFPEYVPKNPPPHLQKLRLRHLLTMTSGLAAPLFFADDPERYRVKDWISHFFNAGFAYPPGERFLYSNFCTYITSCLIERRAKQNLLEYLRGRLFEPLGIGNPDWWFCPKGHTSAANGLFMTIDELANFGEMLRNEGAFGGRQIVPASYLKEATVKQTENVPADQIGSNYQTHGYGYFFWMTPLADSFICNGNYGQYCLVMPKKETVISVLSLEGNNYKKIRDILIDTVVENNRL